MFGQPLRENSIFAKPLAALTHCCCRYPVATVALAVIIAAVAVYCTVNHLTMKMSRLDLINPHSGFNQLWLEYIDEFGDTSEVIVAAEGQDSNELKTVFGKLATQITAKPEYFQSVLSGVDLSNLKSKGLHYLPLNDLKQIREALHGGMRPEAGGGRNMTGNGMQGETGLPPVSRLLPSASFETDNYFIFPTQNGFFGFVLLKLCGIDKTQFSQGTETITQLRSIIAEVRNDHPHLNIGLTGMPVLENDEMLLSNEAMAKATVLAFVGVTLVFIAGFGSMRFPSFAVLAMLIAFAWTLGYITFAVGHLNILSIAFGAMLIGLGTDFSVHYLARFLDLHRTGQDIEAALVQTAETVGPGILTGALTTSAAFYAASFAEFTGIAELGMIAGGGILFCVATTFTVFPALIILFGPKHVAKTNTFGVTAKRQLYDVKPLMAPFFWFPKLTLFLFVIGFSALCCGIPKVWYDHNLLHLQPEGLESVDWEQRLLEQEVSKGGKNIWFALSIANTKEELLERKKRFNEKYPELSVEEIVSLLPEVNDEKNRIIKEIHDAASLASGSSNPALNGFAANLVGMSQPEPPTEKDLPPELVERFVGKHGRHLMRIYTTANIWDMEKLEEFVQAVRDIDPKATGSPLQTYESSLQMQKGFVTAAFYALGVIFIILLLDYRNFGASLAALLPMALGFAMMFGIIGWLDIPLNPANMIVLPLILGIGIDDGVYLVHDYRSRREKKFVLSVSTASAVVITTLTTMIGFGSMMIASHRGLQSLGRIFVIGTACCLFTSLIIFPILLREWTGEGNAAAKTNEDDTNNGGTSAVANGTTVLPAAEVKLKRLVKRDDFGGM